MIFVKDLNIKLGIFQIKNLQLKVKKGEFLVLLGPTAAGKSVVLEAIAGLVPIQSGKIMVNNRDITHLKPEHRNISICYQDYNLFPHMNVQDNIRYGLRFKKDRNNPKYEKNFKELVKLLKIGDILKRLPLNLSGGEQQRVSLARGLIGNPDVLLLDEPLSALDPNIKTTIQEELKNIHQTLHTTIIMVTHDFVEANYLAERVAIINEGEIVEQGYSEEIFQKPGSIFAARFMGIKNIFWIEIPEELSYFGLEKPSYIGIRAENIYISQENISTDYHFQGTIGDIQNNQIFMEVKCCNSKRNYSAYLTVNYFFKLKLKKGQPVHFGFNKENLIHLKKND
ncbi:MAG: ATP-binding cassette domain-containing protein [Atribacterota bacterium]|jgi:ABC-type sugar transport system ATPase subunit|nr:ATP-binding cassette domain-containing protein [Atribacterota bacterium]